MRGTGEKNQHYPPPQGDNIAERTSERKQMMRRTIFQNTGLICRGEAGAGGGSEKERLPSFSCPSWLYFYLSPSFSIPHVFQACQGARSITLYLFKFIFSFAPVSWPVQPAIPLALLPTQPCRVAVLAPQGPPRLPFSPGVLNPGVGTY